MSSISAKTNIAKYLEPEYPQLKNDESSYGFEYSYIGPDLITDGADPLYLNAPAIGQIWDEPLAINRPPGLQLRVRSIDYTPRIGNSGFSRLTLNTVQQITQDDGTAGNAAASEVTNEEEWSLVWMRQTKPLIQHPAFIPTVLSGVSGSSSLAISAGSPARTGYEDVAGWEAMPDGSVAKKNYQYYVLNDDGTQSNTLRTIPSGTGALAYAKLRNMGAEFFDEYIPILTKTSLYRGKNSPPSKTVGRWVDGDFPPGANFAPPNYEWVKTADSSKKQGKSLFWDRTEEWTGAPYILYDNAILNPAGIALS